MNYLKDTYPPVKGIISFLHDSEYEVLTNLKKKNHKSENLTMLCYNIRSMAANMDKFVRSLSETELDVQLSFLIITETWMKETDINVYGMPGYQHIYVCRKEKRGGGVSILANKNIDITMVTESSKVNKDIELITVKMFKRVDTSNKNTIILAIYRPPDGDPVVFMEQLGEILDKCDTSKNDVYVAGDFNINLANFETDKTVQQFMDMMQSYSLTPLYNIPTRITKSTATIIDNIFY